MLFGGMLSVAAFDWKSDNCMLTVIFADTYLLTQVGHAPAQCLPAVLDDHAVLFHLPPSQQAPTMDARLHIMHTRLRRELQRAKRGGGGGKGVL